MGDCLNRLTHVAAVATDSRFSAAVAERAAVRYDAARLNCVSLDALPARSSEQVRALYRDTCQAFDSNLADRCLEEEKAFESGSLHDSRLGQRAARHREQDSDAKSKAVSALCSAFEEGASICMLWNVGKCERSESRCGKAHVCPACGSRDKACLIRNHATFLNKHVPAAGAGSAKGGKGNYQGAGQRWTHDRETRPRGRTRSRSRGREHRQGKGSDRVKQEESPSRSRGRARR